jgi:hypothetical protein
MPGVPRELIEHSLNVDPKATPKRQHLRHFTDDRRDAIKKELAKLLAAGFIKEVFHLEWLANPVLVHKLENKFYGLEFHHVVRDNNVAADVLSKLGSTRAQVPAGVFVHELHAPSIPEPAPPTTVPAHPPAGQEVMMIDVDWR